MSWDQNVPGPKCPRTEMSKGKKYLDQNVSEGIVGDGNENQPVPCPTVSGVLVSIMSGLQRMVSENGFQEWVPRI